MSAEDVYGKWGYNKTIGNSDSVFIGGVTFNKSRYDEFISTLTIPMDQFVKLLEMECKLHGYDSKVILQNLSSFSNFHQFSPYFLYGDHIKIKLELCMPKTLGYIGSTGNTFISVFPGIDLRSVADFINFDEISINARKLHHNKIQSIANMMLVKAKHIIFKDCIFWGDNFDISQYFNKYHFSNCTWKTTMNRVPVNVKFTNTGSYRLEHERCERE